MWCGSSAQHLMEALDVDLSAIFCNLQDRVACTTSTKFLPLSLTRFSFYLIHSSYLLLEYLLLGNLCTRGCCRCGTQMYIFLNNMAICTIYISYNHLFGICLQLHMKKTSTITVFIIHHESLLVQVYTMMLLHLMS